LGNDVSSSGDLGRIMLEFLIGTVLVVVGTVGIYLTVGVGDYILSILNRTGFTIPSSANYVTPIGGLPSSLFLIMSIVFIVIGIVIIIEALLKYYGNLGT